MEMTYGDWEDVTPLEIGSCIGVGNWKMGGDTCHLTTVSPVGYGPEGESTKSFPTSCGEEDEEATAAPHPGCQPCWW